MTINLLDLAKANETLYRDVECSFGHTIRVYHVPDVMVLAIGSPYSEPTQPIVRMKTTTGFQDRLSKPSDKEYKKWQSELLDYNEKLIAMRTAIRMTSALRDIKFPDISKPPTDSAAQIYNGNWPENEILRKKIWLDFTILSARVDSDMIFKAINEMNGIMSVDEDMIDEVKKSSE